jgi:hypothetical protein
MVDVVDKCWLNARLMRRHTGTGQRVLRSIDVLDRKVDPAAGWIEARPATEDGQPSTPSATRPVWRPCG